MAAPPRNLGVEFREALERLQISVTARQVITSYGIEEASDLEELFVDDVKNMFRDIAKLNESVVNDTVRNATARGGRAVNAAGCGRAAVTVVASPVVKLSVIHQNRIFVFHWWCQRRSRMRQDVDARLFNIDLARE